MGGVFQKGGNSESFQYSLNEALTGKTWIDGKPIYRKTFGVPDGSILNSQQIIEIGAIVGNYFKILDGGAQKTAALGSDNVSLPHVDILAGYSIQVTSSVTRDTIIVNNGVNSAHVGGWITLEYTKS